MILLPGLDGTEVFLRPLLAALPRSIATRVLVFPQNGPGSYDSLLAQLRDALEDVASCIVFAASFSGPLAVMLAAAAPGKVRGLILCATFLRVPSAHPARLRLMARAPLVAALRALRRLPVWLLRRGDDPLRIAKRETWARVPARALAARGRAVLQVDVRSLVESCCQPLLAVAYDDDGVVPRGYTDEILQHRPAARLVSLPGGHLAMFSDPAPLAAEIIRFIEEIESSELATMLSGS